MVEEIILLFHGGDSSEQFPAVQNDRPESENSFVF